jgi:hypothetical protein
VVTGGNAQAVVARSLAPLLRNGQVILLIQAKGFDPFAEILRAAQPAIALTFVSQAKNNRSRDRGFADSPLEGGGFELSVPGDGQSRCSPFCAARLLGMDRRTGAGVPRFSSIIMRGKPSTMPPHTCGVNCMYTP